mmetsp:Transcript_6850/g.19137  ORF Transcript_6850/g.19137 Transcript_6850/m.19137 type:complete len:318 (+) Transcript_6850:49-1002(+)|eukprot:CAMPEP_0181041490 /NCGR_PEP_ID=MMETSP1070-20121207/11628_1 /TAXON_ID=265543 /ORGANISM="Minutocellus polymorphus, Strain NH13" /LENGTH=317 /DNA_ID=CAMNT_0023119607 /DNA_START=14 /DNA_END=967 /DNA_ORIENTATION=+
MSTRQISALLLASAGVASGFAPVNHISSSSSAPANFVAEQSQRLATTSLEMARRGRPKGPLRTIVELPPMNEGIDCPELRVSVMNTDVDGGKDEALGVLPRAEALAKAKALGVDLILINAGSEPPVAKIADYSKYRYNLEKKAKDKKKNAKSSELKEVKMSYKIDKHDYEVRRKNAAKFLNQGNRVKCTVMFRGREIQHDDLGRDLLVKLSEDLTKTATMEGRPKREGRSLSCFLLPRPEVLKAIGDKKRAEEKAKKAKKGGKNRKKAEDGSAEVATAVAAEATTAVVLDLEEDDDGDESSLDDLLGGDDLTDDLFG